MSIDLAPNNPYGLVLHTPVMTAAGCFGYAIEYARIVDLEPIGAIVTRSTSLRAYRTSRRPQIIETPAGLLRVGEWPNPGLRHVLEHYAPIWAGWSTPVLLSVIGEIPADYADLAAALEGVEGIAGLELTIVDSPARAAAIVAATRAVTQLPLLVKLPAQEAPALIELGRATVAAGADALTLIASPRGLHIDPQSGERFEGWLSGPALRPLALHTVATVAAAVDAPVIGSGGVAVPDDARQFLAAGATAVQIGAALLADPFTATRIAQALGDS